MSKILARGYYVTVRLTLTWLTAWPFLAVQAAAAEIPATAPQWQEVEIYARDRQAKGFNAALLMTVQPDLDCTGPRSRTEDLGFDVGFEDLPKGTLRQLRPEYFQNSGTSGEPRVVVFAGHPQSQVTL